MKMFGNSDDPLAKTLKEMDEHADESQFQNMGDFFSPVHERDTHIKPKNEKDEDLEFNAVVLNIDEKDQMMKYIILKNKIVNGDCMGLEENTTVDKEDGSVSVFVKWLQPKGMFVLGSADVASVPVAKDVKDIAPEPVVDDTQSTPQPKKKKYKGKGSRKKNKKVTL